MHDSVFDWLIVAAMLFTGWRVMTDPSLYRAIVLFVALGLFLAVSWTRLAAPDIALADAAIGAGLTGVLLLDAVGRWDASAVRSSPGRLLHVARHLVPSEPRILLQRIPAMLAVAVLAAALVMAVLDVPGDSAGLRGPALANLDESGVENPVTAVLLNYRAYDTWLEVVVLFLAILCLLALRRTTILAGTESPPFSPALSMLARLALPVAVVVAGYLYAQGAYAPGGAFQAGAVVAAGLVLLSLAGIPSVSVWWPWVFRVAVVAAPVAFLGGIVLTTAAGSAMLEYRNGTATLGIYLLEAAVAAGTAVTLLALFAASAPPDESASERSAP